MSTKRRTVWTFVVTSAALFMASLDNLVVTTALPSIREHLHASLEGLQWTVNAYTLTFAERSAGEQQHGERQRVGVDGPLQPLERGVQVVPDRGQRGGDHEVVQRSHEQRDRRDHEGPDAPVFGVHLPLPIEVSSH